jgi:hypothetical protein
MVGSCMARVPHSFVSLLDRFRSHLADGEVSDRSFGFTLAVVFFLLGLLPLWKRGQMRLWALLVGALLALLAIFCPGVLRVPKRAWLFLGFLLGLVVNPIMLGLLFFLVLTPAGILLRALGHDPLSLRQRVGIPSYWRPKTEPVSDMKDQF